MSTKLDPLDQALAEAERLRLFPDAATRIQEIAANPRASTAELEAAVSLDPILTGQLLKLANSSLYARGGVRTLRQAIVLLGFRRTQELALALAALSLGDSERPMRKTLWRHAVLTGAAARQIAIEVTTLDSDEAFIAGLLHDVGHLILLALDEETYLPLLEQHWTLDPDDLQDLALLEHERRVMQLDHARLAGALVSRWHTSSPLPTALLYHHTPLSSSATPLAAVLWLADHYERLRTECDTTTLASILAVTPVCQKMRLGPDDLASLVPTLNGTMGMVEKEITA